MSGRLTQRYLVRATAFFLLVGLAYAMWFEVAARAWTTWDALAGILSINVFAYAIWRLVIHDELEPGVVFLASWYGFLAVSRLRLSLIQVDFGAFDFLMLTVLPFVFYPFSRLPRRLKLPTVSVGKVIDYRLVQSAALVVYVLMVYMIYRQRGTLLLSEDISYEKSRYAVPFVSMAAEFVGYLMLALMGLRKWRGNLLVVMAVVGNAVLIHYSRGNLFRILVFLVFLALVMRRDRIAAWLRRNSLRAAVGVGLVLILFTVMGEIRYRSNPDFDIVSYTETRIPNATLAWLNTYFSTPYDLAAMTLRTRDPLAFPYAFVAPALSVLQLDHLYASDLARYDPVSVRGINSVGGLAFFLRDLGPWYVLEWALYALLVGVLWNAAVSLRIPGVAALTLTFVFFVFFDAALLNAQVLAALIAGLAVGIHVRRGEPRVVGNGDFGRSGRSG